MTRISADQGVGIRRAGYQGKWSLVAGRIEGNHGFRGLILIVGYRAGLVSAASPAAKASFLDRASPYPPGRSRNAPFVGPAERIGALSFVRGAWVVAGRSSLVSRREEMCEWKRQVGVRNYP